MSQWLLIRFRKTPVSRITAWIFSLYLGVERNPNPILNCGRWGLAWIDTSIRNLKVWKCCLNLLTVVQSSHHQITFSVPWLISCADGDSKTWMKLKTGVGRFVSLNQSSVESSFKHNDGNRWQNMMGHILMNKHFSYVIWILSWISRCTAGSPDQMW